MEAVRGSGHGQGTIPAGGQSMQSWQVLIGRRNLCCRRLKCGLVGYSWLEKTRYSTAQIVFSLVLLCTIILSAPMEI